MRWIALRRLPPLNALKAFEAAARHESFTRAAEELFVTQGAVSHQVKALETELGVKLFNRERQQPIPKRDDLELAGRQCWVDDPICVLERERYIERHHEATVQQIPRGEHRACERNPLSIDGRTMSMLAWFNTGPR